MDEDSPWGAPSFPPASPPLRSTSFSPSSPAAASESPPTTATTWGDDGGGWGNSVDDSYGSFGTARDQGREGLEEVEQQDPSRNGDRNGSIGDAWGTTDDNNSFSTPTAIQRADSATHERSSTAPPLSPSLSSPPAFDSLADSHAINQEEIIQEPEDDGGWQPTTPPLPPISTLAISQSPNSPTARRASTSSWEPASLEDVIPAPPLPSVQDLFSGGRGESDRIGGERGDEGGGEDGEEAWGAAQGWEEGQEKERRWEEEEREEIERKIREAEEAAERGEESWSSTGGKSIPASLVNGLKDDSRKFAISTWNPQSNDESRLPDSEQPNILSEPVSAPASEPPITNDTPLPSLFRLTPTIFPNFREGISKTAQKSNETLKGNNRTSRFGFSSGSNTTVNEEKDRREDVAHAGDEYDIDAPGRNNPSKSSWWGRSRGGDAQKKQDAVEEDRTVGSEANGQQEQQEAQVGTIGRLFNRFKKNAATSDDGGSNRSSAEVARPTEQSTTTTTAPTFKDEDFDALGSGQFGQRSMGGGSAAVDEDQDGGFFAGDVRPGATHGRLGSFKSRARIPTAPPEDDFGGLLGAFSSAPVARPVVNKAKSNTAFDPFDPLADNDPLPAQTVTIPPIISNRSPSSFAGYNSGPVSTKPNQSSTGDESFDAFFDSVTSSIPKPPLSSIPTPPLPATSQRPPSILLPKSSTARPNQSSMTSPIPRITSASPPHSISPVSITPTSNLSRSTTPILPLAPPPPPSQPLAQRNNLLGSLAPPPPPPPATTSTLRSASISPPPPAGSTTNLLTPANPLLAPSSTTTTTKISSPSPPPPMKKGSTGPLSQDDLSFFENP